MIQKRQRLILEWLNREGSLSAADLKQRLGVSLMTVWRDLSDLESQGKLRRVHGGAVPTQGGQEEIPQPDIFKILTSDPQYHLKQAVARYAAEQLVEDGDKITLEAGITTSLVVPHLQQHKLTVLTNGLYSASLAATRTQELTLLCSGGVLIDSGAFIGPQAEAFFQSMRVDKAFFGASGLTLEDGVTDPTPLYVPLKNAMKNNAQQIILLLNSSKLNQRSLVNVMHLGEVDILVTNADAPPELISRLRQAGVDVRLV
ncbi:MAG: DeoR/GlpR transcriptional regulator [Chloroflexi bacterium]|nr:DeoR/GlpR transcriptional regulator [Chloroflexota bacterium]